MTEPPSTRVPLAQLRAAMEAATPGPWKTYADGWQITSEQCNIAGAVVFAMHDGGRPEWGHLHPDAALICALRNNADALLAAAESAEKIRALCEEADRWHTYSPREMGDAYAAETVIDFLADIRAALPPIESPEEKP